MHCSRISDRISVLHFTINIRIFCIFFIVFFCLLSANNFLFNNNFLSVNNFMIVLIFFLIFFCLLTANNFLFKNNFLSVNNFLLLLIHASVASGALLPMTFGAAMLAVVPLPSPPDRRVTSGGACFRTFPRSASMARGASRKATRPLVPAETHTIPSRVGHKTAPPGQETSITLFYRDMS